MTIRAGLCWPPRVAAFARAVPAESRRRLWLAAGPLAGLWALAFSPSRFAGADLVEGLFAAIIFACGADVLRDGFRSAIVEVRANQDACASLAAFIGAAASFLFAALHAAGRLPAHLEDPRGGPALLLAPAATITIVRFAGRHAATLPPGASDEDGGEDAGMGLYARLFASLRMWIAGLAALAVGLALPHVQASGGARAGAATLMAVLAALAADAPALIRALSLRECSALLGDAAGETARRAIEKAARVEVVVFEKGGVLTLGRPEVSAVHSVQAGWHRDDILHLAAAAEYGVSHPIRDAILRGYRSHLRTVPQIKAVHYLPGRGICANYHGKELVLGNVRLFRERGWPPETMGLLEEKAGQWAPQGETVIFLALSGALVGAIAFRDPARPECEEVFRRLAAAGLRSAVLTADTQSSYIGAGREGVEVHGGLLSEEKAALITRWEEEERAIAVAGSPSFIATCGSPADLAFIRKHAGDAEVAGAAPCAPAGCRFEISSLLDVPARIEGARRIVRLEQNATGIVALHHAALFLGLSGALVPWIGIPPMPALASILTLLLPAWIHILFGVERRSGI